MATERIVADTNVLISRVLFANSVSGRALRKAVDQAQLLISEPTFDEVAEVLSRPKFAPYLTVEERRSFLGYLDRVVERVVITDIIRVCRDPKDDKFLELAVSGAANLIVTGDKDLLALHPFRGVNIVTPAQYVDE